MSQADSALVAEGDAFDPHDFKEYIVINSQVLKSG